MSCDPGLRQVVAASRALHGFSGATQGELIHKKQRLLEDEGVRVKDSAVASDEKVCAMMWIGGGVLVALPASELRPSANSCTTLPTWTGMCSARQNARWRWGPPSTGRHRGWRGTRLDGARPSPAGHVSVSVCVHSVVSHARRVFSLAQSRASSMQERLRGSAGMDVWSWGAGRHPRRRQ